MNRNDGLFTMDFRVYYSIQNEMIDVAQKSYNFYC